MYSERQREGGREGERERGGGGGEVGEKEKGESETTVIKGIRKGTTFFWSEKEEGESMGGKVKGKERCGRRETKHTFRGNSAVQGISIDQDTLS